MKWHFGECFYQSRDTENDSNIPFGTSVMVFRNRHPRKQIDVMHQFAISLKVISRVTAFIWWLKIHLFYNIRTGPVLVSP